MFIIIRLGSMIHGLRVIRLGSMIHGLGVVVRFRSVIATFR